MVNGSSGAPVDPSVAGHLSFPGTFKSMLNPSICGDISISIPGYQCINDLFLDNSASASAAADGPSVSTSVPIAADVHPNDDQSKAAVKSHEFAATINLTYRQSSMDQGSSGQAPSANQQVSSLSTAQKRISIPCRGKISISGQMNNSSNGNGGSDEDVHVLKQYEMMFVQTDFDPSMQFFSVTFSKTLVQNTSIPAAAHEEDGHHYPFVNGNHHHHNNHNNHNHQDNRGLMLSGHYSMIRGYDVGTVRVHLPGHSMRGDLAPIFTVSGGSDIQKESPRNASKPVMNNVTDINNAPAPPPGLFASAGPVAHSSPYAKPRHPSIGNSSPYASAAGHNGVSGPTNANATNKSVRYCYGCGNSGHLHKDCPRDQLFCYNCNQPGHSSKNCKKPKPWQHQPQPQVHPSSDNSDISTDSILMATGIAPGQFNAKKPLPNFVPRHQNPSMTTNGKQQAMIPQNHAYGATWNMKPVQESLPKYTQPPKSQFSPNGMSPYMQPHGRHPQAPPSPASMQISPGMKLHANSSHDMSYGVIGSPLIEHSQMTSPDIRSRSRGYTTSLILGGNGGNVSNMNNPNLLHNNSNNNNASIHGGRRPNSFASFSPNSPGNFLLETVDDFELAQNDGMGPAGDMDSFLGRLTDIDEHESVQTTPPDFGGYLNGGYHTSQQQYPYF